MSGRLITPFSTRSMSQFRWNGYQFHNPCHWAEFRNCHISASNWEKRSDNECPDGQHPAKLLQTTIRLRGCEQNKITNYEPDRSRDETKKEAHWSSPLITIYLFAPLIRYTFKPLPTALPVTLSGPCWRLRAPSYSVPLRERPCIGMYRCIAYTKEKRRCL